MPASAVLVGTEEQGTAKVYFEFSAFLRLLRHAKASEGNGAEGFLIGGESTAGDIVIETVSEAALATGGEALKQAQEDKDILYPFMDLIGMYVCRAGSAGEASEADVLYQRSYFSDSGQTMFVYDPLCNTGAFYVWRKGVLKRLEGFYLFARTGEVDMSLCESVNQSAQEQQDNKLGFIRKLSNRVYALSIATFISIAVLLVAGTYLFARQVELEKRLSVPIQIQAEATASPTENVQTIQETETPPLPTPKGTGSYTVQKGDTLDRISLTYYGTTAKTEAIARANNMTNNSVIMVGQKLIMPED